jgi:hypothetical protein
LFVDAADNGVEAARDVPSTRAEHQSNRPHHVALRAEKVEVPVNREVIFCAAGVLSATPLTYSLRRDFVAFYFAKPEDAEASRSGSVENG